MTEYEILIHLRGSVEPQRIRLPGVPPDQAEADRETLIYDLEQARLAEVPHLSIQTGSGYPTSPLVIDPHEVTEIDLIERPAEESQLAVRADG